METDRELSREELALMEGYLLRGDPIPDVANGLPRLFRLARKGLGVEGLVREVKRQIEAGLLCGPLSDEQQAMLRRELEIALAYREAIKEDG